MNQDRSKVIFLDRDGVINKKPQKYNYILKVSDFEFNVEIFKELKDLQKKGYAFIVITNQRCVALRLITRRQLEKIHSEMVNVFLRNGILIKDIFYCPHQKDRCECRKPKVGLLEKAFKKYSIDKDSSFFVGDSYEDEALAKSFNIKFIKIESDQVSGFSNKVQHEKD